MNEKTLNVLMGCAFLTMVIGSMFAMIRTPEILRGGWFTRIEEVLINNRDNVIQIEENRRGIVYLREELDRIKAELEVKGIIEIYEPPTRRGI